MDFQELDMRAAEDQKAKDMILRSGHWPLSDAQKKVLNACAPENKGETDEL